MMYVCIYIYIYIVHRRYVSIIKISLCSSPSKAHRKPQDLQARPSFPHRFVRLKGEGCLNVPSDFSFGNLEWFQGTPSDAASKRQARSKVYVYLCVKTPSDAS